MSKAIDKNYLLTQLKSFFSVIIEPNIPDNLVKLGQGYGNCNSAKTNLSKVVSLSDYELKKNGIVSIKFKNDVPASSTLNINSKGNIALFHKGEAIKDNVIFGGDTVTFMYDGTNYVLLANDTVHVTSSMVEELFTNFEFTIDESSGHLNITY